MKKIIAGVDEVGRGSLVGPVYAAAVILDKKVDKKKLKDSKKINKQYSCIVKYLQIKFKLYKKILKVNEK